MSIDSVDTETVTDAGKGTVSPAALVAGLTAVLPHTAPRKHRIEKLSAVKFESSTDGKTLTVVATNRYTLATYRMDWDGGVVDALLDMDDAKALLAFAKKVAKQPAIALTFGDSTVAAFDFQRRSGFPLITDQDFISWEMLMPSAEPNHSDRIDKIGFNPEYLALFAKVPCKSTPMVLTFAADATRPVRVDIGDAFTGLVMPVRKTS